MDAFYLKLALSFLVGGAYIAFTIWLSERFGSKIGGIAIGLPSTTLVSFIFIAWTANLQAAVDAVPITPLASGACVLFVAAFVHFFYLGRKSSLAIALAVWAALTFPFAMMGAGNIFLSLAIAAVFFAVSMRYLGRFQHRKLPPNRLSGGEFLFRAAFAGAVVATAVFLAHELGPIWGGLFAVFPAAYSSTLLLLSKKHGLDFTASVARSMPYGSIANVVFEVSFFFLALPLGLWGGIAAAYALSLASALVLYRLSME
jgi:hypothetical protein